MEFHNGGPRAPVDRPEAQITTRVSGVIDDRTTGSLTRSPIVYRLILPRIQSLSFVPKNLARARALSTADVEADLDLGLGCRQLDHTECFLTKLVCGTLLRSRQSGLIPDVSVSVPVSTRPFQYFNFKFQNKIFLRVLIKSLSVSHTFVQPPTFLPFSRF
jgi:hypothetical protein